MYAALIVIAFASATIVALARARMTGGAFNFATSDAKGYYVYIASAVIDRDLDIENQMRQHWGRELDPDALLVRTPRGFVKDKYPIGQAVSIAPAFALAHAICVPVHALTGWSFFAPHGYSPAYQLLCVAWIHLLAWAALVVLDRLLVHELRVSGDIAFWSVIALCGGSTISFQLFSDPMVVHVISFAWVTFAIALAMRIARAAQAHWIAAREVVAFGFTFSMALITRPTDVFILPFLLYALREIVRHGLFRHWLTMLPLAMLACLPIALQMAFWKHVEGRWLLFSYDTERFYWTEPELWRTLFSSRSGLFWYSPLLLIAMASVAREIFGRRGRLKRCNPFFICSILSFVLLWYINAAWWAWWFGESWGGRAYVESTGLFAIGLAYLFDRARSWPNERRRLLIAVIGGTICWHWILFITWYARLVPRADYLIPTFRITP